MNKVTLSVNIFERTYRNIFQKDFFENIENKFNYKFDQIHIIINNVNDRDKVGKKVLELKDKGIITNFYFVEDYIDKALKKFKINYDVLGKLPYYSNHLYVALFVTKTKFLCHFDPDNIILKEGDWIKDSIDLLNKDSSVMVTAPRSWKFFPKKDSIKENEKFYFCYGFGDPIFFIRKKDFNYDIYRYKCMASSATGPLSHISAIFEERVGSYMRCTNKLFAYHKKSSYSQPNEGSFYKKNNIIIKLKRLYHIILRIILELLKIKDPKYRIQGNLNEVSRVRIIKEYYKILLNKININKKL